MKIKIDERYCHLTNSRKERATVEKWLLGNDTFSKRVWNACLVYVTIKDDYDEGEIHFECMYMHTLNTEYCVCFKSVTSSNLCLIIALKLKEWKQHCNDLPFTSFSMYLILSTSCSHLIKLSEAPPSSLLAREQPNLENWSELLYYSGSLYRADSFGLTLLT